MRRQFNKGGIVGSNKPMGYASKAQKPAEMVGAAVFGSRVQPQSTAMKPNSTKPGSQITEITSNLQRDESQITKTHIETRAKATDDSFLNEASFAANQAVEVPPVERQVSTSGMPGANDREDGTISP